MDTLQRLRRPQVPRRRLGNSMNAVARAQYLRFCAFSHRDDIHAVALVRVYVEPPA